MSITVREVKYKKDRYGLRTNRPGTVYDVYLKYKREDGSYKTYGKRGFLTKSDALAHKAEMHVKLRDIYYQKGFLKYHKSTLQEYLSDWLEEYAFRYVAANTYRGYESNIRVHISPLIGSIKLQNVTSEDIDRMCSALFDGGYADATIKYVYRTLSVALEHAKKHKYIQTNPVRDTFTKFKNTRIIPMPFNLSEIKYLLENVIDTQWKFIVILAGIYGLRRGEVFGLRLNNIDLEKRQFRVVEQLSSEYEFKRSGKYTSALKTKGSIRILPIINDTFPYFKAQIENFFEKKKRFKEKYKDLDILICKVNGDPYRAGHTSSRFRLVLDVIGMRHIRFHDLRRSAATNMFQLTGDFCTVGAILGHTLKGIGITLDLSTNFDATTTTYIDIRTERIQAVLETYHKALVLSVDD